MQFPLRICMLCLLLPAACGITKPRQPTPQDPDFTMITQNPLPPEKAGELLEEVSTNWLYGEGFGSTLLNVGTAIIFPPYAIYLLGNGALTLAGYEPIYWSNALPEQDRKDWQASYSQVVSIPGRVAAATAGEEFRTQERAKEAIKKYFQPSTQAAQAAAKNLEG